MSFAQLSDIRDKLMLVGYDKKDTLDAMMAVKSQLDQAYDLAGAIRRCKSCSLRTACTNSPIPGMGDTRSPVMILGESPGEDDMAIQAPFVGPSGQLLTIMLNKLGVDRRDIYITNVIKCGGTKEMTFDESQQCLHHFYNEIAIIQPRVIIALGNAPLKILRNDSSAKITQERGGWFTETLTSLNIEVMPTYNPAYLFHLEGKEQQNAKNQIWRDLKSAFTKVQSL